MACGKEGWPRSVQAMLCSWELQTFGAGQGSEGVLLAWLLVSLVFRDKENGICRSECQRMCDFVHAGTAVAVGIIGGFS